jgi:hypothetical protein
VVALLLTAVAYLLHDPSSFRGDLSLAAVTYDAWDEVIRVDFRNSSIHHTAYRFKYADDMSGNPVSRTTDTLPSCTVTPRDLRDLERVVLNSDFMAIENEYGAPLIQRAYVYRISVATTSSRYKVVEYRSNPSFDKPPDSFFRVQAHLIELSKSLRGRK